MTISKTEGGPPARASTDLDLEEVATRADRQSTCMFLSRLPIELRNHIYNEIWYDGSLAQHILLVDKGGGAAQLTHVPCITDHSAPDERQIECAKRDVDGTGSFEDFTWGDRLHSPWSNHWKCQEAYNQAQRQSTVKAASSFLPMLLTCRRLYVECHRSIYDTLSFVIHDVPTLHALTVARRQPFLNSIKFLNLSIRLPLQPDIARMKPQAIATMDLWREACMALSGGAALVSVNLWLDTVDSDYRHLLRSVNQNNPFMFDKRLASVLTVTIPAHPENPRLWQDIATIEPSFTILGRGWPLYDSESHWSHEIFQVDDNGHPGGISPDWPRAESQDACGYPMPVRQLRVRGT